MPDDALLAAADKGQLNRPAVLAAQVRRMLLDPKANALVENFGGQWLQVRKLESVKPDAKKYPDGWKSPKPYLRIVKQPR